MSHQLRVVPAELSEANAFVALHHRHHQPVVGHRFSLALVDERGRVVGVLIAGRPVARLAGSPREVLEFTRLATDGTRDACSALYAAVDTSNASNPIVLVVSYRIRILRNHAGNNRKLL